MGKNQEKAPGSDAVPKNAVHNSYDEIDARWSRLEGKEWQCSSCGQPHLGVMGLSIDKPDAWPFGPEVERFKLHDDIESFLSDDLCVVNGEGYFVRCMLYLPINKADDHKFGFGVWSSLSKQNFQVYRDSFGQANVDGLGPWFGWFSNSLKSYPETLGLKCSVTPNASGIRPTISLEPTDHPLSVDQRSGISVDRLFEIYAANGHKMS